MTSFRLQRRVLVLTVACLVGLATGTAAQAQGRSGFGSFRHSSLLIDIPEVLVELSVVDEQQELLEALEADLADQRSAVLMEGGRPPEDPRAQIAWLAQLRSRIDAFDRRGEELISIILEPDQADRLTELRLQREGPRAFRRPELLAKLEVNEEQRREITTILNTVSGPPGEPIFGLNQIRKRLEKQEAEILAVMSDEQKRRWKELQGESFQFPGRVRFGRRPRDR